MVSRSRSSPTRMTSASWRMAARRAAAKLVGVVAHLALREDAALFVVHELDRVLDGDDVLVVGVVDAVDDAASVVDLPEPVGPVTSTRPLRDGRGARSRRGSSRSSSGAIFAGMIRNTARARRAAARSSWRGSGPRPAERSAKSRSPRCSKSRHCSALTTSRSSRRSSASRDDGPARAPARARRGRGSSARGRRPDGDPSRRARLRRSKQLGRCMATALHVGDDEALGRAVARAPRRG